MTRQTYVHPHTNDSKEIVVEGYRLNQRSDQHAKRVHDTFPKGFVLLFDKRNDSLQEKRSREEQYILSEFEETRESEFQTVSFEESPHQRGSVGAKRHSIAFSSL